MINKYNREFLLEYVESENKKNKSQVSSEAMDKIVSLIEYFGIELYRPIARLLLTNWQEITNRINNYSEADWMMADEIHKSTPTLDRFYAHRSIRRRRYIESGGKCRTTVVRCRT